MQTEINIRNYKKDLTSKKENNMIIKTCTVMKWLEKTGQHDMHQQYTFLFPISIKALKVFHI